MSFTQILYFFIALMIAFYITNKLMARGIHLITAAQLKEYLDGRSAEYFYLDVRTVNEFKNNHIKRFKNIPLNELKTRMDKIPKDSKIIVICQSGNRSSIACRQLKKAGYKELYNVQGGMNLWKK